MPVVSTRSSPCSEVTTTLRSPSLGDSMAARWAHCALRSVYEYGPGQHPKVGYYHQVHLLALGQRCGRGEVAAKGRAMLAAHAFKSRPKRPEASNQAVVSTGAARRSVCSGRSTACTTRGGRVRGFVVDSSDHLSTLLQACGSIQGGVICSTTCTGTPGHLVSRLGLSDVCSPNTPLSPQ